MTDVNVSVILFTYTDTSLELMEIEVPTMQNIRTKLTEVTQIVYDWATNIVEYKLRKYSQELTCMVKVVEGTQNVIEIILLVNGIPIEELPEEYVKEFDIGMPILIETLYNVLEINFTINISATRYVASDITKSLQNKMPGESAEILLPSDVGWYRIVGSNINIGNCLATFYLNGTGTNFTDAIVFSGTISYGSAALLQQISYSHNNIGISQIRLVYNRVSSGNYAYIDVYKSVVGEQSIILNAVDCTGWNLYQDTAEIATIPSGYDYDFITLTEGGIISTGLKGLKASIDELNYSQNLTGNIQNQLDGKSPTSHSSETDTYGLASDTLFGHTKASSTIPLVASETASAGSEINTFARGDHIHPIQIDIPGTAEIAKKLETARGITIVGGASSSKMMFDGSVDIELPVNTLDGTKITGMIPVESIPKAALERLVVVANDEERFLLTEDDVQKGDTVKVNSTQKMYFVVDTSQLSSEAGYEVYTAGSATSVPWSGITDKPTEFNPTSHASATSEYGLATDNLYGHAKATVTTPKANASSAKVGSEMAFARGDHVHPLQTYVDKAGVANYVNWSNVGGKPLYYTYFAICETEGDIANKIISLSEFTLSTGVEFTVRFKNTNTAEEPVLTINGGTGIPMYYNDTVLTNIQANQTYTFYYYAYSEIDPETEEEIYIEKFIAKNVDWDNISNKPSTYNPTSHASNIDVYGLSSDELYGHAKASSTTPLVAGETASIGSETTSFARGDHIHPVQINVSGNAGTATKLQTVRKISISDGATGTATDFDGSADISIPITALNESALSSPVAIERGGTGATTANNALINLGLTATSTELNYSSGVTSAIQTQLDGKEPAFDKNTAFNKNFGNESQTVCEGNDSRLSDARTPTSHASNTTTYGVSSESEYGHAKASTTTPIVAGIANIGDELTKFARGDHVHPAQTSVSGNAGTATKLYEAKTIEISGGATGTATAFDGSANITIPVTALDATKLNGVVPVSSIPPTALAKLVVVSNDTARFALTTDDVKKGDTVKVTSTDKMYFVVDTTKLSSEAGYEIYTAGAASSVPWSGVTNKPTEYNPTSHASTETTYGISSSSNYGHAKSTSETPIVAGIANIGTDNGLYARGDHVHPSQTSVSGNAGTATALETSRTIAISGGATGTATAFDGSANITIPVTALDATKLTGMVPLSSIPPAAIPRLMIVADDAARFALTTADVQNGDTVKVNSTGKMYFVVDDNHLNTEAGYQIYTAGGASSVPWAGITDKPTEFNPSAHASTHATGGSDAITPASIGAEPTISKNTAFNQNFETTASNIKVAGTANVGNLSTIARADHVHPAQTSVSGNAGTATALETSRTIAISGGATGTATAFDGSANITIPVTAIDESKLSSAVAVARGGTGATTAAGALTNLGLTATAAELNYCDGVTSAIQTQLDSKVAIAQGVSSAGKFLSVGSDGNVVTVKAPSNVTHGVDIPIVSGNIGDLYLRHPVDYIQIGTASELVEFATRVNNGENTLNAILTDDIDLTSVSSTWIPIGFYDTWYLGIFNGNGHIIRNLTLTSSQNGGGLFGYLKNATISNILVDNLQITSDNMWGGIFALFTENTIVTNCAIINSSLSGEHMTVGGILACDFKKGKITNFYAYNCTVNGMEGNMCGGFIQSGPDSFIINCGLYGGNKGNVWYSPYSQADRPTITNSYNSDDVTSEIFHNKGFWDGSGISGTTYLSWNFIETWNWDITSTLPILKAQSVLNTLSTELYAYNSLEWKNITRPTILNGTDEPSTDIGKNGDIYVKYSEQT